MASFKLNFRFYLTSNSFSFECYYTNLYLLLYKEYKFLFADYMQLSFSLPSDKCTRNDFTFVSSMDMQWVFEISYSKGPTFSDSNAYRESVEYNFWHNSTVSNDMDACDTTRILDKYLWGNVRHPSLLKLILVYEIYLPSDHLY